MSMGLKNIRCDYHRNGVSGEGFWVCLFHWEKRPMMGVLFGEKGQCAVFDVDELARENIQFAKGNSWRGDDFEPELRLAILEQEKKDQAEVDALIANGKNFPPPVVK